MPHSQGQKHQHTFETFNSVHRQVSLPMDYDSSLLNLLMAWANTSPSTSPQGKLGACIGVNVGSSCMALGYLCSPFGCDRQGHSPLQLVYVHWPANDVRLVSWAFSTASAFPISGDRVTAPVLVSGTHNCVAKKLAADWFSQRPFLPGVQSVQGFLFLVQTLHRQHCGMSSSILAL